MHGPDDFDCAGVLGIDIYKDATGSRGHVAINNFEKSEYWTKKLVASKNIISDIEKRD